MAFKTEGIFGAIKSIYTGFGPCLSRQILNQAIGLSIFYGLKTWWTEKYVLLLTHKTYKKSETKNKT